MKVAVCLSGFPRVMEFSYPYLKKYILDELNPDIFYFGYEDKHAKKEKIQSIYQPALSTIREYTPEVREEIWEAYGTREIRNTEIARGIEGLLSQYYNIYNSNRLKSKFERDNGFVYDMVIRARTDYYFFRKIEDSELPTKPNHVYIPAVWDFYPGAVSSGFAYGDSAAMDIYSNLFNRVREYNLSDGFRLHPESIKGYHLRKNNITRVPVKNHFWWDLKDFAANGNQNSYISDLTTNPNRRDYQ